mgnify:CR=1 FL=1
MLDNEIGGEEKKLSVSEALNIGINFQRNGNLSKASEVYREILKCFPEQSDAHHLLGLICSQLGDWDEAIKEIKKAIELNPNAIFYGNLGMVYQGLNNFFEAFINFEKALELNPVYDGAYLAHYNLGIYYTEKKNFERAIFHYDKCLELNNSFYDAYWNRGLILLVLGKYKDGFEDYEYRFKKKSSTDSRDFRKPKWNGEDLNGKRILVSCEQGFGDSIQFVRYIPLIKERGGDVILECKKELKRLFENFNGLIDGIVDKQKDKVPEIDFDYYIHLMSLPRIFDTTTENVPFSNGYIHINKTSKREFDKSKFNIGIVWSGNPDFPDNSLKSANFEDFKILTEIPGIKFYSLQKGKAGERLNDSEIEDLTKEIFDFRDTAEFVAGLDLIISIDTSIAHLAGAMRKDVWVLLNDSADWRFGINGNNCVWYSSMRLFRQKEKGDWKSVFEEVKRELERVIKERDIFNNK